MIVKIKLENNPVIFPYFQYHLNSCADPGTSSQPSDDKTNYSPTTNPWISKITTNSQVQTV